MPAIVAGCASVCYAQGTIVTIDQPPPLIWKEFVPEGGGCSIQFPGTPDAKVSEVETSKGKIINHAFTLRSPDSFYHLSYMDYPDGAEGPEIAKARLNAGRDGMFAQHKEMKLLSERELALGSFPGREFLILQNQSSFGIFRTYMVHARLYEIAMLAPVEVAFGKGSVSSRVEDRTKYFNSLARNFLASLKIDAATETMGEVERKLHEFEKEEWYEGVLTMASRSQSDEPATQKSITGGVLNGRAVRLVSPAYPPMARASHASGAVSVKVLIDLEGNVAAAESVEGHPLLRPAAVKAARESKFTPTKFEGKPVLVLGVIIYNFVAQ